MTIAEALEASLSARADLDLPDTDCVRWLHGTIEGAPGVAIDRYGPVVLVQTWRDPLTPEDLDALRSVVHGVDPELKLVWNHRAPGRKKGTKPAFERYHEVELPEIVVGREHGLSFDVRPRHHGSDPLLFLDLRAGRRKVRAASKDKRVLNLFAYTCGIGVAAAAGGATEVWNVDFAASALEVGRKNAELNGVDNRFIHEDCLPVMRQLSGQKPGGRRGKRPRITPFMKRTFDLVVLDPPRWARSAFGAVDVIRDYPSLFKPAVLATEPGGHVLATNHVSSVSWSEWTGVLERCAAKAGRPVRSIERIEVDPDFPSPDGESPLKMAWVSL